MSEAAERVKVWLDIRRDCGVYREHFQIDPHNHVTLDDADLRALLAERDALLADLEKAQATADVRQGQIQALRESVNKWRDKYQVALCCGGMEGCPECAARTHTQEGE